MQVIKTETVHTVQLTQDEVLTIMVCLERAKKKDFDLIKKFKDLFYAEKI